MKGFIRLIQGILTVVWLAVLAASIFLCVGDKENGMPQIHGVALYTVEDSSMEPALSEGDVAVIAMGREAQPGDEVLIGGLDQLMLSRFIGTTEGQLILKADNLEEPVLGQPGDVLGVCTGYLEGFGPVMGFLGSVPGIVAVWAAGVLLILVPAAMLKTPKPPKRQGLSRQGPPRNSYPAERPQPRQRPPRSNYQARH